MPLNLAPYESMFLIFEPVQDQLHVEMTNLSEITNIKDNVINALAAENGLYQVKMSQENSGIITEMVTDIPAPLGISGNWVLTLQGQNFPARGEKTRCSL